MEKPERDWTRGEGKIIADFAVIGGKIVPLSPEAAPPRCVRCGEPKDAHMRNFAGLWCFLGSTGERPTIWTPTEPVAGTPPEDTTP